MKDVIVYVFPTFELYQRHIWGTLTMNFGTSKIFFSTDIKKAAAKLVNIVRHFSDQRDPLFFN